MIVTEYVVQPAGGVNYLQLFRIALGHGTFDALDAAVAYATTRGVDAIQRPFVEKGAGLFEGMSKRWLVGIDWCRSDPIALARLAGIRRSQVRIHDGAQVVKRRGCTPVLPFHPKAFVLRGPGIAAIVSGSGNLSENGMTRGHEWGSVTIIREPVDPTEPTSGEIKRHVISRFNALWRSATPLAAILDQYSQCHDSAENLRSPTPTDDDSAETTRTSVSAAGRRAISPDRLRKLRVARNLWIYAGNLHHNRGAGQPGNQLMMTPMTRVFFGFPAKDVPTDTLVGHVAIRYGNNIRSDCSLRFSNNSMDVLSLPVPGNGGPPAYDRETLRFEKCANGVFQLHLGSLSEVRAWQRRSGAVEGAFKMTSGRKWGVY